jgi:hypothetical protein
VSWRSAPPRAHQRGLRPPFAGQPPGHQGQRRRGQHEQLEQADQQQRADHKDAGGQPGEQLGQQRGGGRVASYGGISDAAQRAAQPVTERQQPGGRDMPGRAGHRHPGGQHPGQRPGLHHGGSGEQRAVGGEATAALDAHGVQGVELPVRVGRVRGPEDASHPDPDGLLVVRRVEPDHAARGHVQLGGGGGAQRGRHRLLQPGRGLACGARPVLAGARGQLRRAGRPGLADQHRVAGQPLGGDNRGDLAAVRAGHREGLGAAQRQAVHPQRAVQRERHVPERLAELVPDDPGGAGLLGRVD